MVNVREYNENDLARMIEIWNEVVEEGIAFPQEEILDAEAADIRALAGHMEAILSDHRICVVGSESVLDRDGGLLDEVKPLFTM